MFRIAALSTFLSLVSIVWDLFKDFDSSRLAVPVKGLEKFIGETSLLFKIEISHLIWGEN